MSSAPGPTPGGRDRSRYRALAVVLDQPAAQGASIEDIAVVRY